MTWAIQSVGDVAYLEAILQGLAMMLGAGTFDAVGKIGLLVGVLVLLIQALPGGSNVNVGQLLVAWVLFVGMFGWTTDVVIEDVYSGDTRVVNDVPAGVAVAGSAISQLGYGLTESFETAFSAPAMTEQRWGSYLHTLTAVRKSFTTETQLGPANHPRGPTSNVYQSWVSYIDRCTLYDLERHFKSTGEIFTADDPIAEMASLDPNATFTLYDGGAIEGVELTCLNGFALLTQYTYDYFLPLFVESRIAPQLGVNQPSESEALFQLQAALDALGLWVAAEDFVVSSFIQNVYSVSLQVHALEVGDGAQATMINDALRQRAISWISEARMFDEYVRPMAAFIEGFGYALAPMLALVVTLGPIGIAAAGKFLKLLIWIQLWMPALAVVNLFTYLGVSAELSAIQDTQGLAITSLTGVEQFDAVVQPWLGTAGMMAAAVPALTLMVVWGGAVAMNGLAQRLQGTDVIDEKRSAPSTVDAKPYGANASASLTGLSVTPTSEGHYINQPEAQAFKIDTGAAAQNLVSSATAAKETAVNEHAQTLARSVGSDVSATSLAKAGEHLSNTTTGTSSQTDTLVSEVATSAAERFAAQHGITDRREIKDTAKAMGTLALTGGFGLQTPGGSPVSGSVVASASGSGSIDRAAAASLGLSAEETQALEATIQERFGNTTGFRAELARSDAHDRSQGVENVFSEAFNLGNRQDLSASAKQVVSAEETAQRAASLSNQLGVTQSFSGERLAQLGSHPQAMNYLRSVVEREGLSGAVDRDLQQNEHRYRFGGEEANDAYAMLKTLSHPSGNASADERRLSAVANTLSLFHGVPGNGDFDATRNQTLLETRPDTGGLANRVNSAVDSGVAETSIGELTTGRATSVGVQQDVSAGSAAPVDTFHEARTENSHGGSVTDAYQEHRQNVSGRAAADREQVDDAGAPYEMLFESREEMARGEDGSLRDTPRSSPIPARRGPATPD
ncbi:MAG: conjugal transfer protein TraG N-terminal domain-containing protein [Parvibaculum sp.]